MLGVVLFAAIWRRCGYGWVMFDDPASVAVLLLWPWFRVLIAWLLHTFGVAPR